MLEYLQLFNYVQTIVILVCKQISSDLFVNKINNNLLSYKSYVQPFNYIETIAQSAGTVEYTAYFSTEG